MDAKDEVCLEGTYGTYRMSFQTYTISSFTRNSTDMNKIWLFTLNICFRFMII